MRTWTLKACVTALVTALALTQSGCQSKSKGSKGRPRSRTTTTGHTYRSGGAATTVPTAPTTPTTLTTPTSPAATATTTATTTATPSPTPATPSATGATCHARPGPLPDPVCTPGVTNPQVTQANIASTICSSGWTATIRPPVSYTDRLKTTGIKAYGYTTTALSAYEEDHLISLELGGAPSDPKNLWPEPGASPNAKDKVENDLNRAVCSGKVQLTAAQKAIATDWTTAEKAVGIAG